MNRLDWRIEALTLRLSGELNHQTLLPLWQQRQSLMQQVNAIDLSALSRVDSAGLALLVHLRHIAALQGKTAQICGISTQLHALIRLYNLQEIIHCA